MFGLASRDALTTRQARWTRDVANAVKTQPSKNHNSSIRQPVTPKSIISYMNDESSEDEKVDKDLEVLYNRCDEIDKQLQQIERHQANIAVGIAALTEGQLAIKAFIDRWETNSPRISEFAGPWSYIPYYNNGALVGLDNFCKLVGKELEFVIEIIGSVKDKITLYPFGNTVLTKYLLKDLVVQVHTDTIVKDVKDGSDVKNVPDVKDVKVELKLSDGEFYGVYIIELPVTDPLPTKVTYHGPI